MKAIMIVDIDDALLNEYEDFNVVGEVVATSKVNASWRDCVKTIGKAGLKPLLKKKQVNEKYSSDKTYALICLGYNACIDEILQGEE